MNGNNELHLCHAEMIAAVDFYLKSKVLQSDYAQKVKVSSVKSDSDAYAPGFTVKLEEVGQAQAVLA